jgi:hypothetical protein
MKKYIFLFVTGLFLISTGCLKDEDGYSLDKMWLGFAMVEQVSSDPLQYKITMDNGDVLVPVASGYGRPWYYMGTHDPNSRLKTGDRVLINYTILGDKLGEDGSVSQYYIKVNSVKKVLLKDIIDITEANEDSIGNDPLGVKKVWMTGNLLNFEIRYWGRYEVHYINLVKEPGELTAASQPVQLELRHNDNGDLHDIPYTAFVSFNLENIRIAGLDSVRFRVTANNYEGSLFEHEGTYRYGGSN